MQWAYDHNDPNPRTESVAVPKGRTRLVVWSEDPAHYIAMCHRCHNRMDLEHGNRANIAAGSRAYHAANRARRAQQQEEVREASPDVTP